MSMKILKKFIFVTLILLSVGLFAQQNLSVPLTDDAYFLLENASLRGIIPTLPSAKPYTLSFVLDNLSEVLESDKLTESEQIIFIKTYERLSQKNQKNGMKQDIIQIDLMKMYNFLLLLVLQFRLFKV